MFDKLDLAQYRRRCDLAHELVNKLSIIVGYCGSAKGNCRGTLVM